MKILILLSFSAIIFGAVGCAGFAEKRAQLEANLPEAERSYLIGKYSVSCKPNKRNSKCTHRFNSLSVLYRYPVDEKYDSRFNFTTGSMFGSDTKPDYISYDNEQKGFYFCRILPEGNYSIYSMSFWNFAGGGSGYYLDEKDYFNIPRIQL